MTFDNKDITSAFHNPAPIPFSIYLTMMSSTAAVHESGSSALMEMHGMSSSE